MSHLTSIKSDERPLHEWFGVAVEYRLKKWPCRMSISSMSHDEFKKQQCRPVDFRGLGLLEALEGN